MSISLIILSFLVGARIIPGPAPVGLILAFLSLFVLPGIYITLIRSGSVPLTVEGVCRVFFSGIIYATFIVTLGFLPGTGYAGISTACSAVTVVLILYYHMHIRRNDEKVNQRIRPYFVEDTGLSAREKRAMLAIILVMMILCFVFFDQSGELGISTDAPDHISFIRRSIESGTILPDDSFFREGDGTGFDPRKGLWHPVLSLWAYQADAAPDDLWSMIPSFLAFFALAVFWFYSKELLGTIRLTLLASILFVLFMRGNGIAWLTRIGYSKNLAIVMMWGTTGYLIRYLRLKERRDLILSVFLVVTGIAYHIVFAYLMFGILGSFFIYGVILPAGRRWMRGFRVIVPVLAGVTAAAVIARISMVQGEYNIIHTHRQGLLLLGEKFLTVDPIELMSQMGLVFFFILIASPLVFFIREKKGLPLLAGVLFLVPVLAVINPLTATPLESHLGYLFYRLVYAAPSTGLLALIIYYLCRLIIMGTVSGEKRSWKARTVAARVLSLLLIFLFAALPLRFAISGIMSETEKILLTDPESSLERGDILCELTRELPEGSVVISDPATSYLLSAYTDCFAVVTLGQHGSPCDGEALERISAVRNLFDPALPLSESAAWLMEKDIRYLVVDTGGETMVDFFEAVPAEIVPAFLEKISRYPGLFVRKGERERYILFQLNIRFLDEMKNDVGEVKSEARKECCIFGEGMNRFEKAAEWEGIRFVSLVLEEREVVAGDTVRGIFCWNAGESYKPGLPCSWNLRLDRDYPQGGLYRPWYDKQYRRIVERKKGTFYRYTAGGMIRSGSTMPERWGTGEDSGQRLFFVLPDNIAPGRYDLGLIVRRETYLPNRMIKDYLRNRDSLSGTLIGRIDITGPGDANSGRETKNR